MSETGVSRCDEMRREALRKLWAVVSPYLDKGKLSELPLHLESNEDLWNQPGETPIRYTILTPRNAPGPQPFVIEKQIYGDGKQLVLFSDGSIVEYREDEFHPFSVEPGAEVNNDQK